MQLQLSAAGAVFVPSIVLGELYYGARKSGGATANVARVDAFAAENTVLVCDEDTARRYGELKDGLRVSGRPIPENDIWIAALARQHGLTLATRDAHFSRVAGLPVASW